MAGKTARLGFMKCLTTEVEIIQTHQARTEM